MGERKSLAALVGASLLGGCTLAPAYSRPDASVSGTFAGRAGEKKEGERLAADLGWRDVFGHARLQAARAWRLGAFDARLPVTR